MTKIVDWLWRQSPGIESFILRSPGWSTVILFFVLYTTWRAWRRYICWVSLQARFSAKQLNAQLSPGGRRLNQAVERLDERLALLEHRTSEPLDELLARMLAQGVAPPQVAARPRPPATSMPESLMPVNPGPRPKKIKLKKQAAESEEKTAYDHLLEDDEL
jgi:hypothetical protein